jgi:hypothetical protein
MSSSSKEYNSMPYDHYYCTDWQPISPTSITAPDLNRQSSIPITSGVFLSICEINLAFAEPYIGDKYWDQQPAPNKTASQVHPQKPITSISTSTPTPTTTTTSTSELAVGIDTVRPKEMKSTVLVSTASQNSSLDIPDDGIMANKKRRIGDEQFNSVR